MADYTPDKLKISKDGNNYTYDFSLKLNTSQKGANNGVAELDSNGKVPVSQLPYQSKTAASGGTDESLVTTGEKYTWNQKYSKPSSGIPATDLADDYIEEPSTAGTSGQVLTSDGNGGATWQTPSGGTVTDVQEDGTSILSSGVANILTMTGASSSSAGTKGLVPAPSAGDQNKVLTGGGSWDESPGAKIYEVTGTITNTSGSYSGTFSNEYVTADMKPLRVYYGTPSVIRAKPEITCGAGTVTFACDEVDGTTTVSIFVQKVIADPLTLKSTEFDVLDNRLQNVENVYVDRTLTIATTDWSNGSYTWESDLITANCGIELMETANSEDAHISYLGWTKTTGSITFTITETPADDLEIIVRIINAKANQLVSLTGEDISTDVITGADNVDEALGVLDDAITTVTNELTNDIVNHATIKDSVVANSSGTFTLPGDGVYLFTGYANVGLACSIVKIIGGYATASRCIVTDLVSGQTGVTIDSSNTESLTFTITNSTSQRIRYSIFMLINKFSY